MAGMKQGKRKSSGKAYNAPECCNVIIAATMSAGKTSLINALLGDELLFSANQAATATLTRITPNKGLRHRVKGGSYTEQGLLHEHSNNVKSALLKQWNDDQAVTNIDLNCHIAGLRKTAIPLVIYDTPGPNNSRDDSHKKMLETALTLPGKKLLIYVLNATQLATSDDACLLQEIKKSPMLASADNIIFILNKMDALDEERGETANLFLDKTREYLQQLGYSEPIIIPAMMQASLIARKMLNNKPITRVQHRHLQAEMQRFQQDKFSLNLASHIPEWLKRKIRSELKKIQPENSLSEIFTQTELSQFIAYSGIRTLELYLSQHN